MIFDLDPRTVAQLGALPETVRVGLAVRAALRVVPLAFQDDLDAATRDILALATLRTILTGGVHAIGSFQGIGKKLAIAGEKTRELSRALSTQRITTAFAAADLASGWTFSAYRNASYLGAIEAHDAKSQNQITEDFIAAFHDDFELAGTPSKILRTKIDTPIAPNAERTEASQSWRLKQIPKDAHWSFWSRWYDRAMAGDPLPWDLQHAVALIDDEIWNQGPEAVAREIKRIKDEYDARREMTTEALRQQARSLLATPRVAEAGSRGLAQLIESAIREYNQLPDGLDSLDKLPGIFHEIAEVLASERPQSEREAQLIKLISLMSRTVNRLNDRLADANAARAAEVARGDRPSSAELRRQGFHTRIGEQASEAIFGLFPKRLWGAVGLGIGTIVGADGAAQAERLMGCTDTMIEQLAPDAMPYEFMPFERPAYPPTTEV